MINRFISEMPVSKQPIANRASGVDQGAAGLESRIILTLWDCHHLSSHSADWVCPQPLCQAIYKNFWLEWQ